MLTLGALSFSSPWLLAAGLILPLLWWLLRVTPPPPRRFDFPAVRLLFGLKSAQQTAQAAPLWLIILRLVMAAAAIVAAAGPAWHRDRSVSDGPWLIVVDNGWESGKHWEQRRQRLDHFITQAERDHQPVALLATAPPADAGAIAVAGPMAASAARSVAEALLPQPWPTDRKSAAKAMDGLPHGRAMRVLWLGDGFDAPGSDDLAARLETYGRLEMMLPRQDDRAQMLLPPLSERGETRLRALRPAGGGAGSSQLRALDEKGRSLAIVAIDWADGATEGEAAADWPNEMKSRMTRIVVDGEDNAGATLLLDGGWSRHAVGLIDDGGDDRIPLLDDLFYGERALSGFAEARRGSIATLLQRPLSLMILSDRGALPEREQGQLRQWVSEGGTLVRFAGPRLAGNPDDLLPVRLRRNERLLGGSLSWAQPMALAPMPEGSPFAGLAVPPDLSVSAQILAEPDLALAEKTWARLVDGTPLVTGAPLGKGWLVLIHTTAWPGWSNLSLSGLFPEMLHRLLDRSQGIAPENADRPLPAIQQLDGFGRLAPPGAAAEAWPAGGAVLPGPRHPPGYYGEGGRRRAVNLGMMALPPKPMALPAGAMALNPGVADRDRDLTPWFLTAALLLLLLDLLLVTGLRRRAVALLLMLLAGQAVQAADDVAAVLDTRLAFILTGDRAVDEVSRSGLAALTRQLIRRTTCVLAEPDAVDPERDHLSVYPLLYWPISPAQPPLSPAARDRINDFLRHGGLLLIDSRDGGVLTAERLRKVTEGIDIPVLTPVTDQHVVAKSFYLLHDFPGRLDGATLFAEEGGDAAHDFVSPVLIGGNDWAAAWATDKQGSPSFATVPGGEQQREMAFRFGVNLVIYALTGSYKADQVHVPAILERMHR
jgi:hypothetical protein